MKSKLPKLLLNNTEYEAIIYDDFVVWYYDNPDYDGFTMLFSMITNEPLVGKILVAQSKPHFDSLRVVEITNDNLIIVNDE